MLSAASRAAQEPPRLLLLCFAHAGGHTACFLNWQAQMPAGVRVMPVELPGHGRRIREALLTDYEALVDSLVAQLLPEIEALQRQHPGLGYAAFGHSAGASFGFGVCARLAERLGQAPVHAFWSAGAPPHIPRPPRSRYSDAQLLEEARALAGTPGEVLDNPELMAFFLPILRADFAAFEGASLDAARQLDCPFTVFAATRDRIPPEDIWAWQRHASQGARRVLLDGDHFSVLYAPQALWCHVRQTLGEELTTC